MKAIVVEPARGRKEKLTITLYSSGNKKKRGAVGRALEGTPAGKGALEARQDGEGESHPLPPAEETVGERKSPEVSGKRLRGINAKTKGGWARNN